MKENRLGWQRIAAISLATISLVVVAIALSFDSASELGYDITYPLLGISFFGLVALGAVVTVKQVAPRMGWVLIGTGIGGTFSVLGEKGTLIILERGGSQDAASTMITMAGIAFATMMTGLALLFLLFPNGSLSSRGWRIPVWMAAIGWATQVAMTPFVTPYITDPASFLRSNWDYDRAGSVIPTWITSTLDLGTYLALAAIVLGALSLGLRLRTSSGVERQQVKWVVYSGAAAALGWFFALAVPQDAAIEVVPAGFGAIALTAGLAISLFKYRLYEIDRVISRTVGYVIVVGLLGLVYVAGAIWLPSQLAGDSPLFVAGSTLAVAGMFNPVRRRALSIVDRRFYRSRYDAEKTVEEFSARLQDQVDVDRLATDLVSVVHETMQPSAVRLWVKD